MVLELALLLELMSGRLLAGLLGKVLASVSALRLGLVKEVVMEVELAGLLGKVSVQVLEKALGVVLGRALELALARRWEFELVVVFAKA